jgi:hypothetical protein
LPDVQVADDEAADTAVVHLHQVARTTPTDRAPRTTPANRRITTIAPTTPTIIVVHITLRTTPTDRARTTTPAQMDIRRMMMIVMKVVDIMDHADIEGIIACHAHCGHITPSNNNFQQHFK